MKKTIHLKENDLRNLIKESVMTLLKENSFGNEFEQSREQYHQRKPHGLFGFEMKNQEGEWEYGEITFNPNTNQMSCMGVSIDVDPDMTVDQNIEALYEELITQGYGNE